MSREESINPDELGNEELCDVLYRRKKKKRRASELYRDAKDWVAARLGIPEDGQKTIPIGEYKVTIQNKEGPEVDNEEHLLEDIFGFDQPDHIPDPVWACFTIKARVRKSDLENLEYNDPDWYSRLWEEVLNWNDRRRVGVQIRKRDD